MRSILSYLSAGNPDYVAYQSRVTADGGTMYGSRNCTTDVVLALQAIIAVYYDEVVAYRTRVTTDSGTLYSGIYCDRNRLKTIFD